MQYQEFEIKEEYIELIKLLKAVGIADTGGNAKALVQLGNIKVNGQVELRLRCKLYNNFLVECSGTQIKIIV